MITFNYCVNRIPTMDLPVFGQNQTDEKFDRKIVGIILDQNMEPLISYMNSPSS